MFNGLVCLTFSAVRAATWTKFTSSVHLCRGEKKKQLMKSFPLPAGSMQMERDRFCNRFLQYKMRCWPQGPKLSKTSEKRDSELSCGANGYSSRTSFCCSVWVILQAVSASRHGAYHKSAAEGTERADCISQSSPFLKCHKIQIMALAFSAIVCWLGYHSSHLDHLMNVLQFRAANTSFLCF